MYSTIISDEELLPIGQQVQLFEEAQESEMATDKWRKLKHRLNRELDRQQISMLEYIALSKRVISKKPN